jgi:beta-mannosidase
MLRPKAAYYVARRELAPFALGLAPTSAHHAELWAVNSITTSIDAKVEIYTWTLGGRLLAEEHSFVTLAANQGTELSGVYLHDAQIISARLLKDGVTIARTALWPEPFKYLSLINPEITIKRLDAQTLRIQAKRLAKGVWLSAEDGVRWSDNMFDLFPNDPHIIKAQGLGNTEVHVRWLT